MGTVFVEISSLTWHIGMKTAYYTKDKESKYFGIFIMKILTLKKIVENVH